MKYYLPFVYFFNTRAKSILHKGSFFILILYPITHVYFAACPAINLTEIVVFVAGFVGMFSVYEIGYLYNDVITTRYEESPSYWLNERDRNKVDRRFEQLVAIRVLYVSISLTVIYILKSDCLMQYILAITLLYLFYAFHNGVRNRWNILSDFGLQIFKYCSVIVLADELKQIYIWCFIIILAVPILRSVEFMRKKRLQITFLQKYDVNHMRILYHFSMTLIALILYRIGVTKFSVLFQISIVLLIYRLIGELMMKNSKIREIRKSNFKDVN